MKLSKLAFTLSEVSFTFVTKSEGCIWRIPRFEISRAHLLLENVMNGRGTNWAVATTIQPWDQIFCLPTDNLYNKITVIQFANAMHVRQPTVRTHSPVPNST